MFCSNCGKEASGNYCASCGSALILPETESYSNKTSGNVKALLATPKVRQLIAEYTRKAKKEMGADEFLAMCDKAFVKMGGIPVAQVGKYVPKLYARLGIKMDKSRSSQLPASAEQSIVALLCAMALNSFPVENIAEDDKSYYIEAMFPSTMWNFEGTIDITITETSQNNTLVEVKITIKGSFFDWGKSERSLDKLFSDLNAALAKNGARS